MILGLTVEPIQLLQPNLHTVTQIAAQEMNKID